MTDAFEEILYLLSAIIDYFDSPNRQVLKINWVFDLIDHVISFFWSTVHGCFWSLKWRWKHCKVKETVVWLLSRRFALSFGFKGPSPLLWSTWLMLRSLLPHPPTSLATNQYWLSIATYSVTDSLFSDVMNSLKQEHGSIWADPSWVWRLLWQEWLIHSHV